MLRRLFRLVATAGLVGATAAAVAKVLGGRRSSSSGPATAVGPLPRQSWPPLEADPSAHEPSHATALLPDPEAPAARATGDGASGDGEVAAAPAPTDAGPDPIAQTDVAWVEPDGDVCPTSHPVKAKMGSKIFHLPGGLSYARTRPDRCYRDAGAAEADGLRPAKR